MRTSDFRGPVLGLVLMLWSSVLPGDDAARQTAPAAGGDVSAADDQFLRPELIAIAWACLPGEAGSNAAREADWGAWRPDGSAVAAEELRQIRSELTAFGAAERAELDGLHPLHLVFRIDPRATNSQRLTPSLRINGASIPSVARQEGSTANRLALSVLIPPRRAVTSWPARVDIEVRLPVEEGSIFKTLDDLGETPVDVAPGARLYWTTTTGASRTGRQIFPAVALEIDREKAGLVEYDFFTHLNDGTTESFHSLRPHPTHEVHVSHPLDAREALDRVDLWRLRYRSDLYRNVPTFPGRIPMSRSQAPDS